MASNCDLYMSNSKFPSFESFKFPKLQIHPYILPLLPLCAHEPFEERELIKKGKWFSDFVCLDQNQKKVNFKVGGTCKNLPTMSFSFFSLCSDTGWVLLSGKEQQTACGSTMSRSISISCQYLVNILLISCQYLVREGAVNCLQINNVVVKINILSISCQYLPICTLCGDQQCHCGEGQERQNNHFPPPGSCCRVFSERSSAPLPSPPEDNSKSG